MKKRNYLFQHTSKLIKRWEIIVIAIACANCFQVPLEIAMNLETFESTLYRAIGFLIDLIFVIDILVNFNTTIEQSEKVVYERKLIAQ